MSNAYNFQCNDPLKAATLASLRTADLELIFKHCFGTTVNIMQKFAKPPKCNAAIYIVDNANKSVLADHLLANLTKYQSAANQNTGRPTTKYHHDGAHNNAVWNRDASADAAADAARMQREAAERKLQREREANARITIDDDVSAIVNGETHKDAAEKAATTDNETDESGMTPEERIAAAINDLLTGKKQPLDIEAVRKIAKDEAAKAVHGIVAPTRIHVVYTEKDGNEAVRDLGTQHKQFAKLMALCMMKDERSGNRPNIWLPGPAGSGKTTAAENVAQALGLQYGYMGALMDKTEAFGYMDAHGKYVETEFYKRWKDGGVFLWDEADGSDPMQGVCMNAPLAGQWAAFPCGMVKRHPDFVFIAAANTYGQGATAKYVGRNRLDAATLNRFIKLPWEYDVALEATIIGHAEWHGLTLKYRAAVERLGYDVVISTRNGQNCVTMENSKVFSKEEIIEIAFRDGMTDDQWRQVSGALR